MNGPTPEDIEEMRKLQRRLAMIDDESMYDESPRQPRLTESAPPRPATPMVSSSEQDQIRKHIMAMESLMPDLVEDSKMNEDLREAIVTEKVNESTVQVGTWKIEKTLVESHTGKMEPSYVVSNVVTKESAGSVFVYESAQALLKVLNQGFNLNNKEIAAIMELDEEYQRLRDKALQEKAVWQRAKNNNLEWKQQLYENKFNSSQYKALYIKERIKNYLLK